MAVATATRTLVINPAFLQEIKDCNPDLWTTVDELERVCGSDTEPIRQIRYLTRLLDSVRDQLAMHFSLEESYGYLKIPAEAARRLPRRTCQLAARMRTEHSQLYLRLTDLAEQAEELQYRGVQAQRLRRLVRCCDQFLRDLRAHEEAESELICRCFEVG